MTEAEYGNAGPATDRYNEPVVDPTQNVLDLVNAAISRQDDLRDMQAKHIKEMLSIRSVKTVSDVEHIAEILRLRAEYDDKLRGKETERIDAIRAVDVGAVSRAAEVSAAQAATLANQVAASAETLRGQVEAARIQTATGLATALEPITKSIDELRAAQYQQQGEKSAYSETRTQSNWSVSTVIAVAAVVITGLVGGLYVSTHNTNKTPATTVIQSCSTASTGQACVK